MPSPFRMRILLLLLLSTKITAAFGSEKCSLKSNLKTLILRKTEKIGHVSPWGLPPELEKSLETYWKESTDPLERKFAHTYEKILEARVAKLGPLSRALIKRAGKRIIERDSGYFRVMKRIAEKYSGSHYNPIANRVFLSAKDGGKFTDYITAIHEMEHAIERNESLWSPFRDSIGAVEALMLVPTPIGALLKFSSESRAIGAQWELMRHVPREYHEELKAALIEDARLRHSRNGKSSATLEFEEFRKNREKTKVISTEEKEVLDIIERTMNEFDERFDIHAQIDLKSLEYSHLPKNEFIKKMREVHGYTLGTLLKSHYRPDLFKGAALAFSGFGIYDVIESYQTGIPNTFKAGIQGILFLDLKLYLFLIHEVQQDASQDSLTPDQAALLLELENAP